MIKTYDVAVVGANTLIGEALLTLLAERKFPIGKVYALASERYIDDEVDFGRKQLSIEDLAEFDFKRVQLAFFAAGTTIASNYVPKAVRAGCVVIDSSAQFRLDNEVPLVIPEVNPEAIAAYQQCHILASPNSATIQMLVALKPLHDAAMITRIDVVTYQAVSGTGKKAVEELARQTASLLNGRSVNARVYPKQIAFNVLAQVDDLLENGYTKEEMSLVLETRKLLAAPELMIHPTAARVPVFFGHCCALHIETKEVLTVAQAHQLLKNTPSVTLVDTTPSATHYPTPVTDAIGQDQVLVGRLRQSLTIPYGLSLWVVADNVRSSALNSVKVAELWLQRQHH